MGSKMCCQENTSFLNRLNSFQANDTTLISKHLRIQSFPNEVSHDQEEALEQTVEEEDATPLKKFILSPINYKMINASNNLKFLTQNKQNHDFTEKISTQDQNIKIHQKIKISNSIKRCSIDLGSRSEILDKTLKILLTEKQIFDSYTRIEISQQNFIKLRSQPVHSLYKFKQVIGEGAYGSVYKAISLRNQDIRAIKVLKRQTLGVKKKKQFLAQLELLKKLDHPNVIKLFQVFENEQYFYVVTQYCDGGSIIDFVKSRKTFNQSIVQTIIKQLLGCLNYIHKFKIVHRDIKLENIVFLKKLNDNSSAQEVNIKLLDFGTAYLLQKAKVRCDQPVGTVSYMAPQIIKGFFNEKCDVWSSGVIFYILFTCKSPFKCKTKELTFKKILNHKITFENQIFKDMNPKALNLISKLLEKDLNVRPSATQALQHPWFSENLNQKIENNSQFLLKLSNYYRQNNFISVLQAYLVFNKVNQEERTKISSIFRDIDKNSDGTIEASELIQAYKEKMEEMDIGEIQHVISKLDKDKSGQINLSEFTSAMINKKKLFVKESILEAFDYFDTDKTGYIEKYELMSLLNGCETNQLQNLLKQIDENKDGRISKEQFLDYLLKKNCLFN